MALPSNLQICRTCVLKTPNMLGIFGEGALGCSIADLINELLDLNVCPGDGLPDKICCSCLNELARFKKFKNISHEAKVTLEYILKKDKAEVVPQALKNDSDESKGDSSQDIQIVDLNDSSDDDSAAETVCAPSSPTLSLNSDGDSSICCYEDMMEDDDVEIISEPSTSSAKHSEVISPLKDLEKSVSTDSASGIDLSSRSVTTLDTGGDVPKSDTSNERRHDIPECSTSQLDSKNPMNRIQLYVCPLCSMCDTSASSFQEHLVMCSQKKNAHICEVCDQQFDDSISLSEHRVTHLNDKHEDDGQTNTSSTSSTRSGVMLDRLDEIFMCGVCRRAFKRIFSLRTHMHRHKAKSPVICGECKRQFSTLNKLCKHVVISHHRGFLKCQVCSKRFLDFYSLKCHANELCPGIRPFKCLICESSFKTQNSLDVHMSESH